MFASLQVLISMVDTRYPVSRVRRRPRSQCRPPHRTPLRQLWPLIQQLLLSFTNSLKRSSSRRSTLRPCHSTAATTPPTSPARSCTCSSEYGQSSLLEIAPTFSSRSISPFINANGGQILVFAPNYGHYGQFVLGHSFRSRASLSVASVGMELCWLVNP